MSSTASTAVVSEPAEAMTPAYLAALAEERGEQPRPRATPADAFRAARRHFLAGDRLDMQALAEELGVSRRTLYRWTGDRERLLVDVMSSLAEATLEHAKERARGSGAKRILAILDDVSDSVTTAEFFRRYLESDAAIGLRLITSRETGVNARFVPAVAALLREEEAKGAFSSPVEMDTLAYTLVRVMEAFLYNDTLAGIEPHLDQAHDIFALLLGLEPKRTR